MNLNNVIQAAVAIAREAADKARDAAVAGLTHLETEVDAAAPQIDKLEQTAIADVIEFVPQQYRPEAQQVFDVIAAGGAPKLEAAVIQAAKTGLGWAIQRIDALNF